MTMPRSHGRENVRVPIVGKWKGAFDSLEGEEGSSCFNSRGYALIPQLRRKDSACVYASWAYLGSSPVRFGRQRRHPSCLAVPTKSHSSM